MQAKNGTIFWALVTALTFALVASLSATGESGTSQDKVAVVKAKEEVFKKLIARELLYQESQNNGIKVKEAAVNEQLVMLKRRFPSEAEFKKMLSQMNLPEADIKSQFERGMAIQQFIDKQFVQKVTVSDKEVRASYDLTAIRFFSSKGIGDEDPDIAGIRPDPQPPQEQ